MHMRSGDPGIGRSGREMCLRVEDADVEIVALDKPVITIGRLHSCDVVVSHERVSRTHATIVKEAQRYVLRDCGSRCGTFVNGRRVVEHELLAGDRIALGSPERAQITVHGDGSPRPSASGTTDVVDFTQVVAVLDILQAIGSGRLLDEVLALVIDAALATSAAERGFILLMDGSGELAVRTARGRGGMDLTGTPLTTSRKIPREACRTGRAVVVPDLSGTNLSEPHDESLRAGIRHVVCVPLRVVPPDHGGGSRVRVTGVLYLDGSEGRGMISRATVAALETLATEAALAIESARLYDESAEKALIERDLRLAADIQRALLPVPTCAGSFFQIAAAACPSRTVGGDFFDYLHLDDGRIGFTLGDVAGKGPSAALLAVAVLNHFAALAPVCADPARMMARANSALLRRAVEARFATMFYGAMTPAGVLTYCNAGQEPPLVVHRDGLCWLGTGGAVLGLLPDVTYDPGTVTLRPGDLVVLYSDGITEARNAAGEEFGRGRLAAVAEECRNCSARTTLDRILSEVRRYSAGAPQYDDITVLVMRYGERAGE